MPTAGAFNANILGVYVDDTLIGCATGGSFSGGTDTIDTTCKDTAGWADFIVGQQNWTMSVEGIWKFDATYGGVDLLQAWKDKTVLTLKFSTEVTGDTFITGSAIITSFDWDGPLNDTSTYSVEFTGKAEPTIGAVAV